MNRLRRVLAGRLAVRRRETLAMLVFTAVLALLAGLGVAASCAPDGLGGFYYCDGSGHPCQHFVPNGEGGFTICMDIMHPNSCFETEPTGGGGPPPPTPVLPTPTPVPPAVIDGLGVGSWSGSPLPSPVYAYASIDASTGGGACPDPQNPHWPAGPSAWASDSGTAFNGFWFLRSLEWAQNKCAGLPYASDSASQWGADQAQMFQSAINALPGSVRSLYLNALFADVEWLSLDCDPQTDPTGCSGPLNAGYWYKDTAHEAENVQVVGGFMTTLCGTFQECNRGVYTSSFNWVDITGGLNGAAPAAIGGASLIWIASWDVSQSGLNQQEQRFTNQAYAIYAWQLQRGHGDRLPIPGFHALGRAVRGKQRRAANPAR